MRDDQGRPDSGRIIAAVFLCLLGICMVALGGGCTILWLIFGTGGMNGLGPMLLLLSIAAFVLGIFVLRQAGKMFAHPAPKTAAGEEDGREPPSNP